ncbi:MAG: PAS domain S-box protein [Spirochaetes bacterium]|nr:PAS domain S-box protein [Spirochaetota bacterium]
MEKRTDKHSRNLVSITASSFFLLTVVAITISSVIILTMNYKTQKRLIRSNTKLIAEKTAMVLKNYIFDKIKLLEITARLGHSELKSLKLQKTFLSHILGQLKNCRQIALYDNHGLLSASLSRLSIKESKKFPDSLEKILNKPESYEKTGLGKVYIDEETNEPNIIIMTEISGILGDFHGTLTAELSLRFMWDLIDQVKIENNGYAYIVDKQGMLLAHPDIIRVLSSEYISNVPIVRKFIEESSEEFGEIEKRYKGVNQEYVVGMYVAMNNTDWALFTEIPWDQSYWPVVRQMIMSVIITLIIAFLSGFAGIILARKIAVPIINLTETASRISKGERNLLVKTEGPEEISALAYAFNSMTSQLQKAFRKMEKQLKDIRKTKIDLQDINIRLKALVDHSPLAIMLTDTNGILQFWNRAAEIIYGWKAEEVAGKFIPVIPDDQKKEFLNFQNQLIKKEGSLTSHEIVHNKKDGKPVWISLSSAPLKDHSGRIYGIMSIAADISEKKKIEKKILASLREKEIFLKEIHHRVKNNM